MLTRYPINSRVMLRITRYIASGLLGQVANGGPRGIVRRREISWRTPCPLADYVGQTRQAVVIGYNPTYQELELSLRCAEWDPWDEVPRRYPAGAEVRGRVTGAIERGAFVELEPGVEGFLPLAELPLAVGEQIADWLWPGDWVRVAVLDVDPSHRLLRFGMRRLVARREIAFRRALWAPSQQAQSSEISLAEVITQEARLQLLRLADRTPQEVAGPRQRVLLIEDDETYGAGLESLLRQNGCLVTWERDGASGLERAATPEADFDLVIVDWNLPRLSGYDVIQHLLAEGYPARLAMVLNPAFGRLPLEIAATLRDGEVDVFSKADVDGCKAGLVALLGELRAGEPVTRAHPAPTDVLSTGRGSDISLEDALPLSAEPEDLGAILARVAQDTRATTAVLLRLDPGPRRLSGEASVGVPFPLDAAPPDLMHSPLADVLEEGREVCERVSPDSQRFSRLLRLVAFQGFLGIPLPCAGPARHALLLLKEQGGFSAAARQQARLAAYLIAGKLQERRLLQALQPWQAQNLRGQVVSVVVHEVNNKLGGISYQADRLAEQVRELARWPERAADATFVRDLEVAVERIASAQQEAARLRDQYLGLAASDELQAVEVKTIAEEMVHLLHTEAQNRNVILATRFSKDVPLVHARPSQLRQVLLNLLLNAIQHMAQFGRQGTVIVDVGCEPGARLPVRVRVIDEGPGIHYQLWERIFQFGFTTKRGGAGLGLTISRQIAASLGGRLAVEESNMLWGTTFLLELPKGAESA